MVGGSIERGAYLKFWHGREGLDKEMTLLF